MLMPHPCARCMWPISAQGCSPTVSDKLFVQLSGISSTDILCCR